MRKRLHVIAGIAFVFVALFNVVIWGAVPRIPDVGEKIRRSANAEAPLAATYIALGSWLDERVPALDAWGRSVIVRAFEPAFERIAQEPVVAMDLILSNTYNRTHSMVRTMYWAAPVLLVLGVILWIRRPKTVSLIGRR